MFSSREEMRDVAAQLFAVVVVSGETSQRRREVLKELTSNIQSQVLWALKSWVGGILRVRHLENDKNHTRQMEGKINEATRVTLH